MLIVLLPTTLGLIFVLPAFWKDTLSLILESAKKYVEMGSSSPPFISVTMVIQ